jgi:GDP-4-dehydro-6-deoxy-D-mannose reductase
MKKALIIGAAGFVGGYLIRELAGTFEVHATKLSTETLSSNSATIHDLDILKKDDIVTLLFQIRPDAIFHLAAQSSVGTAWRNPGLTVDVNIKGSINVMDGVRELFYKPRILLIGSGEEYGHIRPEETPISEETLLRPGNIYAATKACQNMIGNIYTKAYEMQVMMVRAFNHIGPAQAPIFVVSDFCNQVAQIEKGLREPVMMVGNLEAKRDFTDVRDVVRAYRLLMEYGEPGETYNVGSGHALAIREILDLIISKSTAKIQIQIDPAKIRPVDVPIIEADINKLHQLTGWNTTIALEQTIQETLDYWRGHIHTI